MTGEMDVKWAALMLRQHPQLVLGPDVRGHFGRGLFAFHLNETTENQAKRMEAIDHSLSTKTDTSSWLSGARFSIF